VSGWIALHRGLLDSELWTSEPFTRGQAWVDLIMLANHKEGFFRKRGVRVDVKRGQVGHSKLALGDRWSWSRGKVSRYLNELEKYGNIVQQKSKLTTLITIAKYEHYQGRQDIKQDNRRTSNRTTDGHQTDINNNDNNDNNENKKEKNSRFAPPSLLEIKNFIIENHLSIDADSFVNFYESKNWMVGKNKMKDWKASARGWHTRNKNNGGNNDGKKRNLTAIEQVEIANSGSY